MSLFRKTERAIRLSLFGYISAAMGLCVTLLLSGVQSLFILFSNDGNAEPFYLFSVTWKANFIIGGIAAMVFFDCFCLDRYLFQKRSRNGSPKSH